MQPILSVQLFPNKLSQLVLAKAETILAASRRRAQGQAIPQEQPSCTSRSEERAQARKRGEATRTALAAISARRRHARAIDADFTKRRCRSAPLPRRTRATGRRHGVEGACERNTMPEPGRGALSGGGRSAGSVRRDGAERRPGRRLPTGTPAYSARPEACGGRSRPEGA